MKAWKTIKDINQPKFRYTIPVVVNIQSEHYVTFIVQILRSPEGNLVSEVNFFNFLGCNNITFESKPPKEGLKPTQNMIMKQIWRNVLYPTLQDIVKPEDDIRCSPRTSLLYHLSELVPCRTI